MLGASTIPEASDTHTALSAPPPVAGSLTLNESGTGYREPFHWTSVLNDIQELNEQHGPVVHDEAWRPEETGETPSIISQAILLLHGCRNITKEELLGAVPPRNMADRLVAHYFTALEFSLSTSRLPAGTKSTI